MTEKSLAAVMKKEAKRVSGLGLALAVIGWIGFATTLLLEIIMIVKLVDASEPLWTELQAFATVEILWIGMLALAAFGHLLRLLAGYVTIRTSE
jgi:preprotein translocase subunit Sss1